MNEIDVRHIHVLEFPKQLLWTDRDLDYFLEEMSSEECRMNDALYDAFLQEMKEGQAYSPEEAFNLAYYECVRISLARYPESKDIFDALEMDIQHNQSHVSYGFTDLVMNMVWAMLHSTCTAKRFSSKLHSYLANTKKLKYAFRRFFTPNDFEHNIYPYDEIEEPKYSIKFTPCPVDIDYRLLDGEWCKLTIGYKEHLIEELLLLWPEDKRESIRKCILDEKAGQMDNFRNYVKKHVVEIIDEPESHVHINLKESQDNPINEDDELLLQQNAELKAEINKLAAENTELKRKLERADLENGRLNNENTELKSIFGTSKIVLTNNSNFARVVQAMVSARYFKRANGDETNATEIGSMLLRLFGVSNSWKSVLQKAYSRENPLRTFDDLRSAAENYWTNRFGLTKEIRVKGKK